MFRRRLVPTGDLAKRDADGYFWFVGRADDVIKSSGHLIGPFEVESALMEHAAVAEAGVIGKPDPMAGETVKAFVSLKPHFVPSDDLRRELLGFARKRLGAAVAPKEIDFVASVPKTRSGKIMRRLLKARELGLPEGDTSTLEGGRALPEPLRRNSKLALGANLTQPALERDHALELLRDMLRVRRFEEKCAELYSAAKIRGFVHLYIGEEAVAVGALKASKPTMRLWPPTASMDMHWFAGSRPHRLWRRCTASEKDAVADVAVRCICSMRPALLWRERDRRWRIAGSCRFGAGRQDAGPRTRHGVLSSARVR